MGFLDWSPTGLVSAGASLVGGLFNTFQQNRNINKTIAAQAEENRKTREYNLQLAKQQNQWNMQQWNRENAYNDPSAQKSRLVQAGLNPDLMYQNGASGLVSASSPEMTSGAPATSQDVTSPNLARSNYGLDLQTAAQIANINANTEKTKADTDSTKQEMEFKAQMQTGNITIQRLNIKLLGDQHELNQFAKKMKPDEQRLLQEQWKNLAKSTEDLDLSMDKKRKEIDLLGWDLKEREAKYPYIVKQLEADLQQRLLQNESLKLDNAQKRTLSQYYGKMLAAQLLGLQKDNILKDADYELKGQQFENLRKQGLILDWQGQQAQLEYKVYSAKNAPAISAADGRLTGVIFTAIGNVVEALSPLKLKIGGK